MAEIKIKYPLLNFGTRDHCAYCGYPSQCRDHCIPISYMSATCNRSREMTIGPIVLACAECNGVLGNKLFDSFEARAEFVSCEYAEIAVRFGPIWESGDLNSLKGKLKQYVKNNQVKRRYYASRSEWMLTGEYCANISDLTEWPLLDPTSPSYHEQYFTFFSRTLARIQFWRATKQSVLGSVNPWKDEQRNQEEPYSC